MKLLERTNLYYIFFSIITYVIIAGGFYIVVEHLIYSEVEKRLKIERRDFENFVITNGNWSETSFFVENKIHLEEAANTVRTLSEFKDTVIIDRFNQQPVPFREYNFYKTIGSRNYVVSIRKSLIESIVLLEYITITMLLSLSIGLLLLFLFQRRISKLLWKPFYDTLTKAKSFEVNEAKPLSLEHEDIHEFNELNTSLEKMTDRIARDYRNLKEFTENASHEIQTPLALINSRIEELIQEKGMSTNQMGWIQDIHESTLRLSKLNHALLLLAKIDNGQFYDHETVEVGKLLDEKLLAFEEIFSLKGITVKFFRKGELILDINRTLADILLNNLLTNAVKHNLKDGAIEINMTVADLVVRNSGEAMKMDPVLLFERFKKQNPSSSSLGLGLAIVKKICDIHQLDIQYTWQDHFHQVRLRRGD